MKKRLPKQVKTGRTKQSKCKLCKPYLEQQSLPIKNHLLLQATLKKSLMNPVYEGIVSKIVEKQPSNELMIFQEIQKDLINRDYLTTYYHLQQTSDQIKTLVKYGSQRTKLKTIDFKLQNFIIFNKYIQIEKARIQRVNKYSKQESSKQSSTKQAQVKILQQLDLEPRPRPAKKMIMSSSSQFELKQLTSKIEEMIRNIKDNRILKKFKEEMQLERTFPIIKFKDQLQREELNKIKRKKEKTLSKIAKESTNKISYSKLSQKSAKRNFAAKVRKNNAQEQMQQYGLNTLIKIGRKRNDKSVKNSKNIKQQEDKSTRQNLSSKRRLNTQHSESKSIQNSSRMPTEYDSTLIVKKIKSKPKFSTKSLGRSKSKSKQHLCWQIGDHKFKKKNKA